MVSYSLHSVSFMPFESVFRQWWLQIAKKTKKKLENCKAMRKEEGKISDECSSKMGFLSSAEIYLSLWDQCEISVDSPHRKV